MPAIAVHQPRTEPVIQHTTRAQVPALVLCDASVRQCCLPHIIVGRAFMPAIAVHQPRTEPVIQHAARAQVPARFVFYLAPGRKRKVSPLRN